MVCTGVRADSITLTKLAPEQTSFQGRREVRPQSLFSQVPTPANKAKSTTNPFSEMLSGSNFRESSGILPSRISPGDVQAVICDCGDLDQVAGGFPKWPFLFLGVIPLVFIINGSPEAPVPPLVPPVLVPPTETPHVEVTPQVPEPDSLVLLVTGLTGIAFALRRNRKPTTRSLRTNLR